MRFLKSGLDLLMNEKPSSCLTAEYVERWNGKGQESENDHASLAQEIRDQAADDSSKDTFLYRIRGWVHL